MARPRPRHAAVVIASASALFVACFWATASHHAALRQRHSDAAATAALGGAGLGTSGSDGGAVWSSATFEAPGMPGQALVRHRPLSGELLASMDEGAWLPDPIAHAATEARGDPEATEARLFGWGELLGTWVEHLMTAIDVAVLGEQVPTLLALADRNNAKSIEQVDALKRFKCGVEDHVRVFVLYLHEFDWLFQAWEIKDLPFLLFFGPDGAANRAGVPGPLAPAEIAETFGRQVAVDLSWATFDLNPQEGSGTWRHWFRQLWELLPGVARRGGTASSETER
uniref:Uncharacterized protein n=1 Tax=Pyrodinium bahamense TaxID=73915 RepID=A0A7S0FKZ2_9DINO